MKKVNILILLFFLVGCSSTTNFTQGLRKEIEEVGVSLKNIQYYTDNEIVLYRELESGNTSVTSGKVKIEKGKYIHYIVIPDNTPGVCMYYDEESLRILFEAGSENYLKYESPENLKDKYRLRANIGLKSIIYDGKVYTIKSGNYSGLVVKNSILNKIDVEKKRLKGVRLESNQMW